jgi:hypothetical protein
MSPVLAAFLGVVGAFANAQSTEDQDAGGLA